jgi:hypothetical protein
MSSATRRLKRRALQVHPGKAYMHLNAYARAEHLAIKPAVGHAYNLLKTGIRYIEHGESAKPIFKTYRLRLNDIQKRSTGSIRDILMKRTLKECMSLLSRAKRVLRLSGLSETIRPSAHPLWGSYCIRVPSL